MDSLRDKRIAERFETACRVELEEGMIGYTRDLSTTGVYFLTDTPVEQGLLIKFCVLMQRLGNIVSRISCEGLVVRTQKDDDMWGVAVTLTNFDFQYAA